MDHGGNTLWTERYTPFGEKLVDPAANADNQGFTGHVEDSQTGLTYMQARYYNAVTGHFPSNDPVGFAEGGVQFFNRYAYAFNNPVNLVDPDGRNPAAPIIACARFAPCRNAAIGAGRFVAKSAVRGAAAVGSMIGGGEDEISDASKIEDFNDDIFDHIKVKGKGKVDGDVDTDEIPDDLLGEGIEIIDNSIKLRNEDQEGKPEGKPNGTRREKRDHKRFKGHKDRVQRETGWRDKLVARRKGLENR